MSGRYAEGTAFTWNDEPMRRAAIGSVPARPVPPETEIEFGQRRACREDRLRYLAHLEVMRAEDRMTDEVFTARKEAAEGAVVIADLVMLTEDLPPLKMTPQQEAAEAEEKSRKQALRYRWEHSHTLRFRVLAGCIAAGAMTAVSGAAIGANLTHVAEWVKALVIAPSIVIGLAVIVWSVILITTDPYHGDDYDSGKPFTRRWKVD